MSDEVMYFNGINAASGDYETRPMTAKELAAVAKGGEAKPQAGAEHFAPMEGVDPKDLSQAGWGVIFAASDEKQTDALRDALKPLLEHRRAQAAKAKEQYYREFTGAKGYQPKETKNAWLRKHKVGPGPANPEKMPYYLLIVGDPEAIPYLFQYQLDVQYAVGRLHFDKLEDYAQYAQNVVLAETQKPFLARRAAFFGVANPDDKATKLSAEKLIQPLSESVKKDKPDWALSAALAGEATKARLSSLLNGNDAPSFLFTASHGMGFPNGHELQMRHQGALLCQDWPGPQQWRKPVPTDFYFSADDLASSANLLGLLAFFFACYGCGTPKLDDYAAVMSDRAEIAPNAFIAGLPKKMLTRGALAVVGHVERAWGTSIVWETAGPQLETFQSTFKRLMEGHPIGSATEYFNQRYSEISTVLTEIVEHAQTYPEEADDDDIAAKWTANNDARSYVVIGDPAARLPVDGGGQSARPSLGAAATSPKAVSAPSASVGVPPILGGEPAPGASASLTTESAADVNYGLSETFQQVKASAGELVAKLMKTLQQVVNDITSLEVKTYISEDVASAKYDAAQREFVGAQLRALTRISLDGDVLNVVPEEGGQVDAALWQIHLAMVEQANANRAEMLKTAVALLGSLKAL
jgi:hypothetical protein